MCGIVGFVDKQGRLSESQRHNVLSRMISEINHRGRDGEGIWMQDIIAIGHARLSILDLRAAALQPFVDEDSGLVLAYNGEIFNYREINSSHLQGHAFRTTCDTETLIAGYARYGLGFLDHLRGMFAFSFYDERRKRIVLGVDRFSIKPLYVLETDDWFAWSSEMKAFKHLPGFVFELDESCLSEFFRFRQVAGASTQIRGVRRMLPAEFIEYDIEQAQAQSQIWWELKKSEDHTTDDETLWSLFQHTVKDHLLADVPLGVQLSGGIDSSLVAVAASQNSPALRTYAIGLAEEGWNEFAYSRAVAKLCGSTHTEIVFTEDEFCRLLPQLTHHLDEPVSHSHSVPMYLLAKRAREDVKVLVSGEGADELFLGYRRYESLIRSAQTDEILIQSNAYNSEDHIRSVFPQYDGTPSLFRRNIAQGTHGLAFGDRVTCYDLQTYLPPLLLRQDKMGMAANLENRVPFLDHVFVETGYALPVHDKISEFGSKLPLKRIAERFFSHDFVYRKKCGFGQPIAQWLRHPDGFGRYLNLFFEPPVQRPYLDYTSIRSFIKAHVSGKEDRTELLWTLIVFEVWMLVVHDGVSSDLFERLGTSSPYAIT